MEKKKNRLLVCTINFFVKKCGIGRMNGRKLEREGKVKNEAG